MKKIILCFAVLFFTVIFVSGCDDIKQIVSDIAEVEIEQQVNEMLGLTKEEELFQLPKAKRYESFVFNDEDDKTEFSFDVINPEVTVEEYAEEMINTFAKGFEEEIDEEELQKEIDKIKEQGVWVYEFDGDTYTVTFDELLAEDGTVAKWSLSFEVLYNQTTEETIQ